MSVLRSWPTSVAGEPVKESEDHPGEMALELGLVVLGEQQPELPQVGYEPFFDAVGWRLGRAFSSRQHRARAIRPAGWSSGDVFFAGTVSCGRSVQEAATATRWPEASWRTTHGSSPFQKPSRTVPSRAPTRRRYLTMRTTCPLQDDQ